MKKILFCAMFLPLALQAQVGINTNDPKATLEVKKNTNLPNTQPQGVLFPKFTSEERLKFSGAAEVGTVIYNADKKCLEMYLGLDSGVHQWACLSDVGSSKAQSVAVSPQGFEGSYIGGVAFSNNSQKVKFKLENNSFSSVNSSFADAVSIQNGTANISITGCTWKLLPSGTGGGDCSGTSTINLASGQAALLTYTMSGTPETGTLTANFSKLGAQADQQTQVGQVGLGSATITSPKTEYVVSLTYNGTTPKTEVQGKINNTTDKLIVKIPYTNGSGSYNAVTSQTITTALGEGNDTNTLTLTIPAGNFGVNGNLEATITVGGDDGEYLVKMLPPGQEYEIATIPYTLNGQSYQLVLKGIGGIPDRCFGKTTLDCVGYGANELEHQFIYVPIKGPDGRTWLNNNLGAEYARVGSPVFNPTQQATSKTDHNAYGSLFQWQRNPDGHELINWSGSSSGTPKYNSPTSSLSSSWEKPDTNQFIYNNSSPYSWVNSSLNSSGPHNLWQSSGADKTNPCPVGYHVPTHAEQEALLNAIGSGNSNMWNEQVLRLPASGTRVASNATLNLQSSFGCLWSIEQDNSGSSWNLCFNSGYSRAGSGSYRAGGFSVRCLKD